MDNPKRTALIYDFDGTLARGCVFHAMMGINSTG